MNVTAKVEVTVELLVKSTWDDSASVSQVFKQAVEEGEELLRGRNLEPLSMVGDNPDIVRRLEGLRLKMVGQPKVTALVLEK